MDINLLAKFLNYLYCYGQLTRESFTRHAEVVCLTFGRL